MKNIFNLKDNDPIVLKATDGKKHRMRKFPEEWDGMDTITVYRAATEEIEDAPRQIVWTTNKGLAFLVFNESRGPQHVYQAEIDKKDVMAYSNKKYRFEVHQYMSVKNVTDITEEAMSNAGAILYMDYEEDELEWRCKKVFGRMMKE